METRPWIITGNIIFVWNIEVEFGIPVFLSRPLKMMGISEHR
jgi:hypothetical protein